MRTEHHQMDGDVFGWWFFFWFGLVWFFVFGGRPHENVHQGRAAGYGAALNGREIVHCHPIPLLLHLAIVI